MISIDLPSCGRFIFRAKERPNLFFRLIGGSMKINQVEELVGITKKNIRFYEDKGLICPERNLENGYRNYTLDDVEQLNKIKLLRKLDIPIDTIRQLQENKISVDECMEEHIRKLSHKQHELDTIKEICQIIADAHGNGIQEVDATKYLEDMQRLEEGGTNFMNVEKTDVRKSKLGPIIAAIVCLLFCVVMIFLVASDKEAPLAVLLFIIIVFAGIGIGIIIALKQRLHEIEGGEIDEARKY